MQISSNSNDPAGIARPDQLQLHSISISTCSPSFMIMPSSIQTLLKRGFTPTTAQINHYLLFLSRTQKFKLLFHFIKHLDCTHNPFKPNSQTHSILIQALLSLHKFNEAELFIRTQMIKTRTSPQNRIWDTLIRGLIVQEKDPDKALCILKDCLGKFCIFPSCYTFSSLIHCFCHNGLMDRAVEVLELMMDDSTRYPFGNFVCSSVISGFCRIGKPELAVEFFEKAKMSRALRGPNVVTCTAVVDALCQLGRFGEVCSLVSEMDEKVGWDAVFYSCWISGYVKEGALMEALRKYKEMLDKGIGADVVTYTTLMDGFSKRIDEGRAVGFVRTMRSKGLEPNLISYTVMISGFCRKGNLEVALSLFRMVENMGIELDEYLYATLIDGACRKCDFNLVFSLLHEMENKGISPTAVTYNTVVNGLCKAERTSEADEFSKGMLADLVTYSTLMHGYIMEQNVSGVLETKRRLEEAELAMDVVMCNVLMKASFMVGAFEDAYALYREMPEMNLIPDSFTYCTLIDGYCKAGRIDESLEIFDDFRKTSICSAACYNAIIDGLCKKGMIELAIDIFIELQQKDLCVDVGVYMMLIKAAFNERGADGVLLFINGIDELQKDIYHSIYVDAIHFLCKRGFFDYACEIYFLSRKKGPTLMCKSYHAIAKELLKGKNILVCPILASLIKDFGNFDATLVKILVQYLCLKDVNAALQYVECMKKENFIVKLPATVFRMLLEEGRALDAYTLAINSVEILLDMNVVDYTVIIDGLCKLRYIDQALDLCLFIKRKGIALTNVTYNSVINGLCQEGRLTEAFRLFDSLERVGVFPSDVTYATLIDALCRERQLHDAELLFQKMVFKGYRPNTHIYNAMINAYVSIGKVEDAFKLFHDFEAKGLKADEFTVSALINGYCQKGDMERALEFFSEVKVKNLSPDLLGFLYLVRGLTAKGRLEEARNVLREMLQSESVGELIKRVDSEVEMESVHMFLVSLCEQGSVKEAIVVVDEIASMHFPVRRFSNNYAGSQIESKSGEEEVCNTDKSNSVVPQEERDLKIGLGEMKKESSVKRRTLFDFDSFYSLVASLCMRGELHEANLLLKKFLY